MSTGGSRVWGKGKTLVFTTRGREAGFGREGTSLLKLFRHDLSVIFHLAAMLYLSVRGLMT